MLSEGMGHLADKAMLGRLRRTARSLFAVVYEGKPRITRRVVDQGEETERYVLRFTSDALVEGMSIEGQSSGNTLAGAYASAIADMSEKLREQAEEDYDEYSDGWLHDPDDSDDEEEDDENAPVF